MHRVSSPLIGNAMANGSRMEKRESNAGDFGGRAVRAVQFRVFLDSDTLTHFPHRAPTDFAPSARHSMRHRWRTHTARTNECSPIPPVIHTSFHVATCSAAARTWSSPFAECVPNLPRPCPRYLTLSLISSAACAPTDGGMAHARQPQISPSCHVRART